MPCSKVQCDAFSYSLVQYSDVLSNAGQGREGSYSAVQYSVVRYNRAPYHTVEYGISGGIFCPKGT